MKKLNLLILLCIAVVTSTYAQITIEDWQIGVVNGSDGTLGVSITSDDPDFTEPITGV